MSKKTLYAVVVPAVVAIFVGAFAIGTDMFDYYCSAGSVFLGIDMSSSIYCKPVVYTVHVVIASLVVVAILNFFLSKPKEKEVSNEMTSKNFQGGTAKSFGQTGGATLSIGQVDKLYVGEVPKKRQARKKTTSKDSVQKKSDVIHPKIQTIGVIEPKKENRGYRAAKIQVANIGKENIECVARLLGVTRKFEDKEEVLSIEKINPNGKFLEWNSSRSSVSNLRVNIPDTVNVLASLREAYTYGDNMIFTFHGYDDVERIKQGEYKISVAFLCSDGNQLQEFHMFEGTLRFNYKTIEWL